MTTFFHLALSAAVLCAETTAPDTEAFGGEDAHQRERREFRAALNEVHGLTKAGRLSEAEDAINRYEPEYSGKWSMGRFGYGTRMELGEAYLAHGDRQNALRLFQSARPGGGCGNCMASQHVQKNLRIANLYESRLNFPAAFAAYLGALPFTLLGGGLFRVAFGFLYTGVATLMPIAVFVHFIRRRQAQKKNRSDGQQSPPASGTGAVASVPAVEP
jgi:hypothetical protein